jgi:hypothetical protein
MASALHFDGSFHTGGGKRDIRSNQNKNLFRVRFQKQGGRTVRGYKEKSNINTPMELAMNNEIGRFTLAIDAIDRVHKLRKLGGNAKEKFRNQQIACRAYAVPAFFPLLLFAHHPASGTCFPRSVSGACALNDVLLRLRPSLPDLRRKLPFPYSAGSVLAPLRRT